MAEGRFVCLRHAPPILCCDGGDGCSFGVKMNRVVPGACVVFAFCGALGLLWLQARNSIVPLFTAVSILRVVGCVGVLFVCCVEGRHAQGSA